MKIHGIVFDLDGTLIDGYDAIHDALNYTLQKFKHEPLTLEQTREMVGHGFEELMAGLVGEERVEESVRIFRTYYPSVAIEKSHLLPGVPEILQQLADSNYRISLASNKPAEFTRMILKANHVEKFFLQIAGPDKLYPPKPNPKMLKELTKTMDVPPEKTVCIGDMEVDVQFARAGGCSVVVLPTGSRSREFLQTAGADYLINTLKDLPPLLKNLNG